MDTDEHRDEPDAEPDEPTAHDGDAEPGIDPVGETASMPGNGEPTTRDLLDAAANDLSLMVAAIDTESTGDVDMDGLLDKAHATLVLLLDGERCPMCQGDGILAVDPPADPRAERCDDCKGRGKVYTGSLVPESAVRPCGKCGGKGFNEVATVERLPGSDYAAPTPPPGAQWYDADDPGTWHLPIDPAKRGLTVG